MTNKQARLSKVAKEFNVGISTITDFLTGKGIEIESKPNTKITSDIYDLLTTEYSSDVNVKKKSEEISLKKSLDRKESISVNDITSEPKEEPVVTDEDSVIIKSTSSAAANIVVPKEEKPKTKIKVIGKIDLEKKTPKKVDTKVTTPVPVEEKSVEEKPLKEPVTEEKKEIAKEKPAKEKPAKEKPAKKEKPVKDSEEEVKIVGKIDLSSINQKTRPTKKSKKEKEKEKAERIAKRDTEKEPAKETVVKEETIKEESSPVVVEKITVAKPDENFVETKIEKLTGPKVLGKIVIPEKPKKKKPVASSNDNTSGARKKRKRIKKDGPARPVGTDNKGGARKPFEKKGGKPFNKKKKFARPEVKEEDVQKQIRETLARLTGKGKNKGVKHRKDKRLADREKVEAQAEQIAQEKQTLKVTEFVTANELSAMMDVTVTEVISTCMSLGLFVSINQRLDAETITIVAEEFNYKVDFISVEVQEAIKVEEDKEEDLLPRAPIVTVMGHVDHGKKNLLDYIRKANVVAGEAGGITQHIGAYSVEVADGKKITFLDTPGHEAFTAMRARGAQITDVVIIVVAADDGIMPQTVEAINHASAAGVPIVFAINKIDKSTSNPEKIKEELANMNYLVEDWGGKYQSQEISALKGENIQELLEKVLLESEMLDLKANPNKAAHGVVLESTLDKGRGYLTTILVEAGTLRIGDIMLAGSFYGNTKAMYNENNVKIDEVGPATPVVILGLNGASQAGDEFNIMDNIKKVKEISSKRLQLQREQNLRTQKHLTLDEIGRRIAIGNFQELNIIVKGDVDGSIEALTDSLQKISTEEIQVNILHKAVGQISESDVLLADASDAIIVGFQVRASLGARKMAEKLGVEIRVNSIIYDIIDEVKAALKGMLKPLIKEKITGTLEIREAFKVSKVGTIAGCMVKEGKINRNSKIRIIREGIVIYTGILGSLKRFKDDVKEVTHGYECGLNIDKYNDIKVLDIVESYEEYEEAREL